MTSTKKLADRARDAALMGLAATFSLAALAKVMDGSPVKNVPIGVPGYLVASAEALIVMGLTFQPLRRWAMRLVLAFSAVAVTFALVRRPEQCGCFGKVATLGWSGQAIVACTMAMLSSYWLAGNRDGDSRSQYLGRKHGKKAVPTPR